jgi:hypothetical protein
VRDIANQREDMVSTTNKKRIRGTVAILFMYLLGNDHATDEWLRVHNTRHTVRPFVHIQCCTHTVPCACYRVCTVCMVCGSGNDEW